MGKEESLADLLERAVHKPSKVKGPGAALALACHTVMIRAGFHAIRPKRVRRSSQRYRRCSPYEPNAHWQESADGWRFHYCKDGNPLPITMDVTLHAESGRVLVCAVEETMHAPIVHQLELLLSNYFPAGCDLHASREWASVVFNGGSLVALMQQYICDPIAASAKPVQLSRGERPPFPMSEGNSSDSGCSTSLPGTIDFPGFDLSHRTRATSLASADEVAPTCSHVQGSLAVSPYAYPALLSARPLYIAATTSGVVALAAVVATAAVFSLKTRA